MLVITAGSIMHILIADRADLRRLRDQRASASRRSCRHRRVVDRLSGREQAGVQAGDIVVSIDGVRPSTARRSSSTRFAVHQPGDTVTFVLDRDGQR